MKLFDKIKRILDLCQTLELSWRLYGLLVLYTIITLVSFWYKWEIGLLWIIFIIVVVLILTINIDKFMRDIHLFANRMTKTVQNAQEDALYRSPIAVLLYDEQMRVKWINPSFQRIYNGEKLLGRTIESLDEVLYQFIQGETNKEWHQIQLGEKYYKIMHQADLQALYLMEITEEVHIQETKKYDQLVFGYLFLDDYLELLQSLDDNQASQIDAKILTELNTWSKQYQIYLKRLEEEKFMILLNQKSLEKLEKNKFKEIEKITEQNFQDNIPISFSIGIAYSTQPEYNVEDLAQQAQLNLDLALGRGGDQVVVRTKDDKARFYGGKLNPNEKRTTTRSKLVYRALINSVNQASNIYIAGHRYPDMDSIASAIGLYKLISQHKKEVKIILNQAQLGKDVAQLLKSSQIQNEWKQLFTDIHTAKESLDERTLIIMVDHHRPSLSEAEEIVNQHDVVIIDHHRRSEDFPTQSVLTFIEPYASSTSELVTEFFIYERNHQQTLSKIEATALLAGIIVDTNNFSLRTGARTFDAASYLKTRGADMVLIQRLLKEELSVVQKRNRLIEKAEYISKEIVISKYKDDEICDSVTAAQAADSMLGLKNVEASFVIFRRNAETIGISARSLGSINVQTIMEQMGGGGHLSNAATQLQGISIQQAYEELVHLLKNNEEE